MRKKSRHAVSESLGQTADMKPEGGGGERFAIKVKGEISVEHGTTKR